MLAVVIGCEAFVSVATILTAAHRAKGLTQFFVLVVESLPYFIVSFVCQVILVTTMNAFLEVDHSL